MVIVTTHIKKPYFPFIFSAQYREENEQSCTTSIVEGFFQKGEYFLKVRSCHGHGYIV